MNVGIVGAGVISREYARNAAAFDAYDVTVCRMPCPRPPPSSPPSMACGGDDRRAARRPRGRRRSQPHAARRARRGASAQALAAGKHVYTEKPLATTIAEAAELVAEAERRGLRLGCAPDVFLAGPYQAARRLLDEGAIGEPLAVSAAMLAGGQSSWHPNPDIFFRDGAGPLLDMGPYYVSAIVALLGPIRRVAGFASTRAIDRVIEIGPRAGTPYTPETPTHTAATLELDGGVTVNLTASFEAGAQYIADFAVYGTEGRLLLPDPNSYGGPLLLRRGREEAWQDVPFTARGDRDARGIGLHELVEAIAAGRPERASGSLALHVVDVARGILVAAAESRVVEIGSRASKPERCPSSRLLRLSLARSGDEAQRIDVDAAAAVHLEMEVQA